MSGFFYEIVVGVILILINLDKFWNLGCIFLDFIKEIYLIWIYDSWVVFEDSIFVENVGLEFGVVYVINGFMIFCRCIFCNNFGI